jgi:hypothetical protein
MSTTYSIVTLLYLFDEVEERIIIEIKAVIPEPEPAINNSDRIAWLENAYQLLQTELLPEAPECLSITFGFPSTGARKTKNQRIGEYAHQFLQGNHEQLTNTGFISLHPTIFNNPSRVLDVLLHEMIHAATPGDGHKGLFPKLAKRCGLAGKMTATTAGPALKEQLDKFLADRLPVMPPGYGDLSPARKKQTTRMLKYVCPSCSQIIRAATDELNAVCGECAEQFVRG